MLLDQATGAQMETAQLLTGATMAGFLAAGMLGRRAQGVRMAIGLLYLGGVLGFVAYLTF